MISKSEHKQRSSPEMRYQSSLLVGHSESFLLYFNSWQQLSVVVLGLGLTELLPLSLPAHCLAHGKGSTRNCWLLTELQGRRRRFFFTLLHVKRLCPARNQGYASSYSTSLLLSFLCSPSPRPYYISPCGFSFCSHYKLNFFALSVLVTPQSPRA